MPCPALGIPRSLISLSGLQFSGCQGQPQGTERQDCAPEGHDKHGDDAATDDAAARLGRREIGFHENLQPLLLIGDSRRDNGVEAERVARDADCVDAHRLETTPFRIVPSALRHSHVARSRRAPVDIGRPPLASMEQAAAENLPCSCGRLPAKKRAVRRPPHFTRERLPGWIRADTPPGSHPAAAAAVLSSRVDCCRRCRRHDGGIGVDDGLRRHRHRLLDDALGRPHGASADQDGSQDDYQRKLLHGLNLAFVRGQRAVGCMVAQRLAAGDSPTGAQKQIGPLVAGADERALCNPTGRDQYGLRECCM